VAEGVTMKKRFSEEQIIKTLKRVEAGEKATDVCRDLGVSMQTIYAWKRKFGGMEVSDAKRLRELEAENTKLKRMVANLAMDVEDLKFVNSKNW
jgi:putative transposase